MYYYREYRKKKKGKAGKILGIIFSLLLALLVVIAVKTLTYPFTKFEPAETAEQIDADVSDEAVRRLLRAVRIPTISEDTAQLAGNPFDAFKAYLPEAYPEVYKAMNTLSINKYGLLFHWKGKDATRKPILFLAHYDVAPVAGYESGEELFGEEIFRLHDVKKEAIDKFQGSWNFPPFSGAVSNGRIYGRGTLEAKGMLLSQLEAASTLLTDSFQPEQDIWFAYGFDKETGGTKGAAKMAEYFRQKNITFEAVYDGGSTVIAPGTAGIGRPVALVGVAEKGFCTVDITVKGMAGSSSMPPRKSSLVLAAEIIEKLNNKQLPANIIPPVRSFLNHVGMSMDFVSRMAIANQWFLDVSLLKMLEKNPATNALVRTTTAVTMAKGSNAPNVLSATAEITADFHILNGESVETVVDHVKDVCADYDVEIQVKSAREPSGLSSEDTRAFRAIRNSIARLYPEAVIASCIALTVADAPKYEIVSKNVYRIMPVCLNEYEQRAIRNENEYISLENYGRMIAYYKDVMATYEAVE